MATKVIAGPAYIEHKYGPDAADVATFFTEENITVTFEKSTKERKASHLGKFDEILLAVKAEIKFKAVEWDHLDALFPWSALTIGAQLFGEEDRYTKIYDSRGKTWTFHRTAVTASAAIGAGVEKDLLGESTITAYKSADKNYDDEDALFTLGTGAWNPRALKSDKIFSIPYRIKYGDLVLKSESGVDIEFTPTLTERKDDESGAWEQIFGGYEASAKFKPTNITEEQYIELSQLGGGVKRGRSLKAKGKTLEIAGTEEGDPKFTLTSAVCASGGLNFSVAEQRFAELEFRALSDAYNTPKFTIGEVEASGEAA